MRIDDSNWISICKCQKINDEYFNEIKPNSKVNPQPNKPPFIGIPTNLYAKFSTFPYKSVHSRMVLDYIIMATWGFGGKTSKRGMEKVALTMSQTYMADQLGINRLTLIKALQELEDAKIVLVQDNRGHMVDGKRISNYYFVNKHYDSWVYPNSISGNSISGNSILGNSIPGNSIPEHTIQYDETDLELGDTKDGR